MIRPWQSIAAAGLLFGLAPSASAESLFKNPGKWLRDVGKSAQRDADNAAKDAARLRAKVIGNVDIGGLSPSRGSGMTSDPDGTIEGPEHEVWPDPDSGGTTISPGSGTPTTETQYGNVREYDFTNEGTYNGDDARPDNSHVEPLD